MTSIIKNKNELENGVTTDDFIGSKFCLHVQRNNENYYRMPHLGCGSLP